MPFVKVAAMDDLWSGEMRGLWVEGTRVLLLKIEETIYAYEDRCAHLGVPLSEGTLEGQVLTCRAHQWQYDAQSGQGINPRMACLKTFPVRIEEDQIWIDVSQAAA